MTLSVMNERIVVPSSVATNASSFVSILDYW